MRTDVVVVVPPALDHHLSLLQCVEYLAIQELIAQAPVEAFVVAILPRAAGCDVERFDA